ncbi:MAG: hypothetical protein WBP38_01220 [Hyphomicrobium sp.]
MDVADVIRAEKTDVEISDWFTGKVTKAKFPLSKARGAIQLGKSWRWRTVRFSALGQKFRLLIQLNVSKSKYSATLAIERDGDLAVFCCHELHVSHKNWHCHFVPGDIEKTYPGVLRDRENMISWPSFTEDECTIDFTVTEQSALSIAAARFRFEAQGELI